MKRATISALLLLFFGNIFAQVTVSLEVVTSTTNVNLREKFKAYTLVRADYEDIYQEHLQNDGSINFVIAGLGRKNLDFTITPWELRSENYFRQIWDGERSHRQPAGRTSTYRGSLAEDANSEAYFTIDRQFILGRWEADKETFLLEPLQHLDPTAENDIYVVYRAVDAIMPPDFCGVDTAQNPGTELELIDDDKEAGPEKAGDCYVVDIALAADFELYQVLGNNETSVENFMLNGLMNVQTNYDNEFADEIQFEVATIYVATCSTSGCDPWTNNTSAGLLLDDFVDWGNAGNFGVSYDVATLWTGRNFNGSTIGVAYPGTICTSLRYNTCQAIGLSGQELRVLWAHELGHNFNAGHDSSTGFIMSPSVNVTDEWSNQSRNTINNFIPTRSCLSNCAISGPPLAFIEVAYEEACEGSYVAFFDESEGNITSRFWDFDGGIPSTSTDPHPIVFFPNGGFYNVTLSVNNAQGSDFASFTVDIDQDDAFPKVLYYENFEDGFGGWDDENPDNNIGWQIAQVNGNFGSNAAYVNNYDYDAAGQVDALISPFFDLSEQAEVRFSFEYAYVRYNNSLNDDLRVSLSTDGGSTFPNILFESGSNFATAPDNLNPFIPNSASDWCGAGPGCIDLDLSAFEGESDVVIKIENITGYGNNMYVDNIALTASCAPAFPPIANFSQDEVIGCAPLTVSFIDQSSGLIDFREWEFPGGNPDYTTEPNPIIYYNTAGVYDVTLFVENSAGSDVFTDIGAVTVLELPVADFTYSNIIANDYSFTSLSTGDISFYEWDFGDGDISNDPNPTHTFAAPGTYVVELRVYNDCGSDLFFETIVVEALLTADFTAAINTGCAPLVVQFTDLSAGNPDSWDWSFPGGDPSFSNDPNPVVTYNVSGTYDVALTVTEGSATESASFPNYISVGTGPAAAFTATSTPGSLVVSLQDQSSGGNTISWDFGDGNTATTGTATSYTYDSPGTYTITQTVENECGTDIATQTVTIILPVDPTFTASETDGCTPLSVDFTASPQETGNSYSWTFEGGDPATSTDPNPTISYTTAGSFDVSLTITNAAGPASLTQANYINIGTGPAAAFMATSTPGSLVVSLQDQSTGANTISWDFGDGNTATGTATSYTYDSPGTYTITQTVENECGTDLATQTVTLILPVDPDFTASETDGCTPLSVDFTASPQETGNSYSWTFEGGDPATSNDPNPTVSYTTAGSFDVSLTITNAAGPASLTQANYINIGTGPAAAFMATSTPGSLVVSLQDQSTGANTISWDFGDGNTATGTATSYTYDSPGTYTITQTVENECGTDLATQTVTLILPVDPTFTASETDGCTPLSVDFTASPQETGNSYSWTFEGGDPATSNDPNPTVSYTTAGSFDVSLTITNAAGPASLTQANYINIGTGPAAAFMATSTPGSLVVSLQDQSTGANTISWDFGDGNTATGTATSYTYDSPGTYTITQTVENECGTDLATQTVTLILPVDPTFTASETDGCTPLSVDFTASPQETGNSYSWTFEGGDPATSNDPNPTVSYTTAGSFDVSLTITNAAGPASLTQANYINIGTGPAAAFMATSTPGSLVVSLEDQSTGANTISWDFGDGNTATGIATSYTYDSPGTYTITQTVENECGTDIATQTVTLILPVDPDFTASETDGCTPLSVDFTASPQETGNSYSWAFEGGDPATSNDPNPTISYTAAGSFDVSLTITNAAGPATITQTDYISVGLGPVASFMSVNTAGEATVSFTNESEGADSYSWNFGDNSGSMQPNPSHSYAEAGTYEVSLTVTNDCGTDTYTEVVTIVFPPSAAFTQSSQGGCAPHSVTYTAQDQNPGNTYAWFFPGGTPASSNTSSPVITYETAGTYDVSLTVTNAAGMVTELHEESINISTVPETGFELNTTLGSLTIDVDGLVNDNTNEWLWEFGDGTQRTSTSAVHTYASSGIYTITLMATNACGTTTSEQTVTVLTAPEATFTASSLLVCPGEMITLMADATGDDITYDWSTPAGMPVAASTRMHSVSFANPGTYMIDLTVGNAAGGNSSQQMVIVQALPTANFDFSVNGLTVNTQNNSANADTYNWTYQGGNSMEMEPVITFAGVGEYEITLVAANACGEATTSQEVSIQGSVPDVSFTATNNEGCGPLSVSFSSEMENADSFSWSFQGGEPATSTAPNPVIVYDVPGTYPVTLTASNAFGGNAITQDALVTVLAPVTADFDYELNETTANFSHTVTGTSTILWTFPDESTSSMDAPAYTFPANGSYTVSLQAIGPCNTETIEQTIVIDGPLPVVEVMNTTTEGCAPFSVTFMDNSAQSPTAWAWDFPGGTPATSNEASVDVTYPETGIYSVGLSVTNIYGTTTQEWTDYVEVIDIPAIPEFSEETFNNISYAFDVISFLPEWTYTWDFGDGTMAEGTSVQHTYSEAGIYTVALTATNDCGSATATLDVIVVITNENTPVWASKLWLSPNPTQGDLLLHAEDWINSGTLNAYLTNTLGQRLQQHALLTNSGKWEHHFDLSKLPAGTYWLQLQWGNNQWTQKVVKL